jgi:mono/diheme cytochrome c family protein
VIALSKYRLRLIHLVRGVILVAAFIAIGNGYAAVGTAGNSQIDRGKYLARAADCGSCHSKPGAAPFSGGEALKTPFGKIYAPNITSDRNTGIGSWTRDDFARTLRDGIDKEGELLYPAMPYSNYTKMSDEDIDAIWAYIRTIPPVRNTAPGNTFPFPLNVRSGLAVWRSLYFKPARFAAVSDKDTDWNRGAYLVEAFGHCGACHTPRNLAMAPEPQHRLSGSQITGWYAPDIGNDPMSAISKWDVDTLARFLKTGQSKGNVKSFGPMQEVVHDSLRYLTDSDLHAMAVYLKDIPSNPQPKTEVTKAVAEPDTAAGKAVYEQQCSSCHGNDGKGSQGAVPALAGNTAVTAAEPYNLIMAVLEGFDPQGAWGAMPSFAKVLDDQQIADVANYVRTQWGNHAAANATPWTITSWRGMAQVPAQGQRKSVICPSLPKNVLQPALNAGNAALKQAGNDQDALAQLVTRYTTARPQSSNAQVIEALSTAYCRAVVDDGESTNRTDTRIAVFAQDVAIALTRSDRTSQSAAAKMRN